MEKKSSLEAEILVAQDLRPHFSMVFSTESPTLVALHVSEAGSNSGDGGTLGVGDEKVLLATVTS
ncbi:hypothetical protein [Natronoglycomyces albus]|uniref:Uncharacterized protein n=1 Tax=Natronoglycomyces albus TaxID=2811108 RepID=A0A895XK72_9ACTN|nr:hypothetical protein [Natronoglycomyces albus]QSB03953.1 hypothetical protein JQS30_08955 [Natronoglycomyces albus]